ncbi:hypothetical protein O6P43_034514 [Quillaja saponaria]|uniref:Uncharacterized protein n=1 Tax=Quillaja saponaria TaxID=32244 RepID=A0AAD7KMB1_QUISA|nr:hypothetical protein O6P43_034514 [Quillaja saponaria]
MVRKKGDGYCEDRNRYWNPADSPSHHDHPFFQLSSSSERPHPLPDLVYSATFPPPHLLVQNTFFPSQSTSFLCRRPYLVR